MKRNVKWAMMLVLGLLVTGCGKGDQAAEEDSQYAPEVSAETSTKTAVVKPSAGDERSPASASPDSIPVDAPPEQIVGHYIQALNDGDDAMAESLLTEVARVETRRADLVPQQAWSSNAIYEITSVDWATDRAIRAEVRTDWVERDANGGSADFSIVWMMSKQEHNGWRISGMKTQLVPGGSLVFLNFEDPADMVARWEQGMLEADREAQVRTASGADQDPLK